MVMMLVANAMSSGTLCSMSSVLYSWYSSPLFQNLITTSLGSGISSAVTMQGPMGAKVSKDLPIQLPLRQVRRPS